MKNAAIGEGTKVPHLTYVGDATIGEYTNIGAASVFVNYDGEAKHHTTIGSYCKTGSDNMFVAPVVVGDGAYTAAGSVITKDVPAGSLAVARGQQRNIEGWVARKRPGSAAAEAADRAQQRATAEAASARPAREGRLIGPAHRCTGAPDGAYRVWCTQFRQPARLRAALCRTPVELRGDGAVTGIKTTGEKKLMLFSGRAHPELAEEVAERARASSWCRPRPSTSPTARSTSGSRSRRAAPTAS